MIGRAFARIELLELLLNHGAPSGPGAIPCDCPISILASLVTVPAVVIRPIESVPVVNHSAPSGPAVIPYGPLMPVPVYVVNLPLAVFRPIELSPLLVNQRLARCYLFGFRLSCSGRGCHRVYAPKVASLAELNTMLAEADASEDGRRIAQRAATVGEDFAAERQFLRPLPAEPFDTSATLWPRTDRYARISVGKCGYSVRARSWLRLHRAADFTVSHRTPKPADVLVRLCALSNKC